MLDSILVYDGPSRFNGKPIVGVLSGGSANTKTGNLATLWALVKDASPLDAVTSGADVAVCGTCESRKGGSGPRCYMHGQPLLKGGRSMWKSLSNKADRTRWTAQELGEWLRFARRNYGVTALRLNAYGDTGAFPREFNDKVEAARRIAGLGVRAYTHQWRDPEMAYLAATHMASTSTAADTAAAIAAGFRVFQATAPQTVPPPGAVLCPASAEAGRLTTCASCSLCSGLGRPTAPSVWIPDHGPGAHGRRVAAVAAAQLALSRNFPSPPLVTVYGG